MTGVPRLTARQIHRLIGVVMLIPLAAWAATGAVFFVKPGYGAAYDSLPVRTYPIEGPIAVHPDPSWREVRHLRTILGLHLLARTDQGWVQLDPVTLQPAAAPKVEDVTRLIADSFAANPARYGHIVSVSLDGGTATTDTGAVITFDWNRLSLEQRGRDTDRIDRLYKIHYLQWTGQKTADKVLGLGGLVLLTVLTALGARLAFRRG